MIESGDTRTNDDIRGTVEFTSKVIESTTASFEAMLDEIKWYVTLNAGAMAGIVAFLERWPRWAVVSALLLLSFSMLRWFQFRLKLVSGREELITNALTLSGYSDPDNSEDAESVRVGMIGSRRELVSMAHRDYVLTVYTFVAIYILAGILLAVGTLWPITLEK